MSLTYTQAKLHNNGYSKDRRVSLTHTQAKLHNNGDSKDRRVSHIHKLSFITMETARTDESHTYTS